ncbi:MAG: GNAT family N-acetyltransferase [Bacteroidales bacterium]|nr:GNAT family N-acetyltransferase [Bacteroidales bacterium]
MTDTERYRLLCEAEGSNIPLFQQHWWLQTVCQGKQWNVVLVEKDGRPVAALPYLLRHKMGLRLIIQPPLTQFCGPWLSDTLTPTEQIDYTQQLVERIDNLNVHLYLQQCSPLFTNWLPYYWHNYRQTTRYTYILPDISNPKDLRAAAYKERRKGLDAAASQLHTDTDVNPQEFATMHQRYWQRRSGNDLLPEKFIVDVCTDALQRKQAMLWGLRNGSNSLVAARFVVYDNRCAHSLMSAISPDAPRNSMSLLVWQMIDHLSSLTQAFDFEGSMDPGIEHFYRSFGSVQTPFFRIGKARGIAAKILLNRLMP